MSASTTAPSVNREDAEIGPSLASMLLQRVRSRGPRTILRQKDRGIWKQVTWAKLGARVQRMAMGLQALGFGPGDVGCVLSDANPDAVYADLAILGLGGVSCGIDPADGMGQVESILRDCRARALFVENEEQLDKVLEVRQRCPALERVVIFDAKGLRELDDPQCDRLDAFLGRGAAYDQAHPGAWEAAAAAVRAEQPAVRLYANVSAGPPKGTTLTHGDVLVRLAEGNLALGLREGDERVAFMPMCHLAERITGLYQSLYAGTISNYLESLDAIFENLREVQPTIMLAMPRLYEELQSSLALQGQQATFLQRAVFRWAIAAGPRPVDAERSGRGTPGLPGLGALLTGPARRSLRREMGLERVRHAYVNAPIAPDLSRWFRALGVDLRELSGVTGCEKNGALSETMYAEA